MSFDSRDAVISFVEQAYFGSAMRADVAGMLDCFASDACVTVRHGDNPARYFSPAAHGRYAVLGAFFEHLCGTFEPWFGDFQHFVDLEHDRSACYFTVRLTPRLPEMLAATGVLELRNCNFFHYQEKKIQDMTIYYSNSGADGQENTPTGYPQPD
jgi:hypothetical protein